MYPKLKSSLIQTLPAIFCPNSCYDFEGAENPMQLQSVRISGAGSSRKILGGQTSYSLQEIIQEELQVYQIRRALPGLVYDNSLVSPDSPELLHQPSSSQCLKTFSQSSLTIIQPSHQKAPAGVDRECMDDFQSRISKYALSSKLYIVNIILLEGE